MFPLLMLFAVFASALSKTCPDGGKIFDEGINQKGIEDVVKFHNQFRLEVAQGRVPNQPRGINLKRMKYDKELELASKDALKTCEFSVGNVTDERYWHVGQNMYMEMTNDPDVASEQEWEKVVTNWFVDHTNFKYPVLDSETMKGGHYTQVVWDYTEDLACHFLSFENLSDPEFPYAKIYTCFYGPGGNIEGVAPYETGEQGCENLC